MGLDFSHTDAHWAYSGFNRFRTRVAAVLGFDLDRMEGFHGDRSWDSVPSATDEPLIDLLNHSDCDGELTPEQCERIAPRLREAVSLWPADDYDRIKAEMLADGMELAAQSGEPLEFM